MKTLTKLVIAAASGYAFRAYIKKDSLLTNDALKHSVDRRISVEGGVPLQSKPTFMDRQFDKLNSKIYNAVYDKTSSFLYGATSPRDESRYSRQTPYERRYSRPATRYSRFGRTRNW